MTLKQAAAALGVSRATVWRRYRAGRLVPINVNPALDKPSRLLFKAEDVLRLKPAP